MPRSLKKFLWSINSEVSSFFGNSNLMGFTIAFIAVNNYALPFEVRILPPCKNILEVVSCKV